MKIWPDLYALFIRQSQIKIGRVNFSYFKIMLLTGDQYNPL